MTLLAEYELDEPTERVPWRILTLVAIVLWSGVWWLGTHNTQTQGETTTATDESPMQ